MDINSLHVNLPSYLNLIVILGMVLFMVLSLVFIIKYKRVRKKTKKEIEKRKANFEKEVNYLKKEIERQNYLINQYKTNAIPSKSKPNYQKSEKNKENTTALVKNVENKRFADKNKKLWELSIAIHKEKEKIDKVKKEIEYRHNEVTKSITYAQRIQKALLPDRETLDNCRFEYFIFWQPRDIVSGDFYWLKQIGKYSVIVVADCTGHGVPGAFMSVLGISFLNDIFGKDKIYPSNQVLEKMRQMMKTSFHHNEKAKKFKSSDGMDLGLAIINNETLNLEYSGANNPLYIIRNNELIELKATRSPIGSHPFEKEFKKEEFQLQKGDQFYMFSDGFVDQFGGPSGRKFLKKNFQRLLLHISKEKLPMEEEKDILSIALSQWIGDKYKQVDDILVLGMRV